jgi:adenylate cyclase
MTVGMMIIGLAIALFLGLRFSKPISELVAATEAIGKGNYRYRVALDRKDELGNLAVAFNQMGEELYRHTLTRQSFGKYVGEEVLEMILADPAETWLKGHKNDATILFADIRGFTAYAEEREPEALVEMLNTYFEITTRSLLEYGGYVDKFIGDCVLGVFGVPVFRKDHVERAVRAALDLDGTAAPAQSSAQPPALVGGCGHPHRPGCFGQHWVPGQNGIHRDRWTR